MSSSKQIEEVLDRLYSRHVISLIIICLIALGLRLYFTRFDFPLESQDAFVYLLQAQQIGQWDLEGIPTSIGWQSFLAFFFMPFRFETNFEYMTILRLISISVSVITIPVVYALGKIFLEKRFALLAAAFFAFGPNLIENSIFGITESLFILCGVLAILFALRNTTKNLIIAAIFAGFSLDVRLNGIVLFIVIVIMCFSGKYSINNRIKKFLIFFTFFVIAAGPYFLLAYQTSGSFIGGFLGVAEGVQTGIAPSLAASYIGSSFEEKFLFGITEEFKHIFRISIPYLVLFVPFGIICSLREFDYKKKIIFLVIIITLLIAMPQYTRSIEYRNLFFILPFFSIIASIGIQYILEKNSRKNLFLVLLIGGLILLSYNFLRERNDIDLELLAEKEMFGEYVAASFKGKMVGDYYTQISHHLPQAKIWYDELGGQVRNENLLLFGSVQPSKTMIDTMKWAEERQIKYFVIDDIYEARAPEFVEVYYNEEEYPYLNKIFDSTENDYRKLRVKIFEIDYNKLE